MFKRIISFSLTVAFIISLLTVSASAETVSVSAESAVVMKADTNEVIFSKNPDERLSMASTTKIMTSIIALESGDLSQEITVTDEMVRVEGTSIGLLAGDKISLEELVYGMMLESGNDAANVTAYALAGGQEQFSVLMNEKAQSIGMKNSHFVTPSGLDSDEHYSTAYDMALLGSYAVKNEDFLSICSAYSACVDYGNPPYKRYFTNHNKMLKYYEGTVGIKTGFTKKSGRCLVSAAVRNGVTLVAVTLNDPNDWADHKKMLDYGFSQLKEVRLDEYGKTYSVRCVGSDISSVRAVLYENAVTYSFSGTADFYSVVRTEPFLYAPVNKGDIVGSVSYYYKNGTFICEIPLIANESAQCITVPDSKEVKKSIFQRIIDYLKGRKNG